MSQAALDDLFAEALRHQREGRPEEAVFALGSLLAVQPGHPDAIHMLGLLRHLAGDSETGLRLIRRSIDLCGDAPARFHANMAEICRRLGRAAEAIAAARAAVAAEAGDPTGHFVLGQLLRETGDLAGAVASFEIAAGLGDGHWGARLGLGGCLAGLGRLNEAVAALAAAGKAAGTDPDRLRELGKAWVEANRPVEAIAAYQDSLRIRPGHSGTMNSLGILMDRVGRKLEAVALYRQAIQASPNEAQLHNNLANALRDLGDWPGALAGFRRALELEPDQFVTQSNVMFTLLYDSEATGEAHLAEGLAWERRRGTPAVVRPQARDPEKRLRVGYVSPDFKEHAVAYFTEPLLANHDRSAVEVVCYSSTPRPDAATERLKALADLWVESQAMTDAGFAERVRADGIDILVDLAGHTQGNRLLAMGQRPAPVQVSALLGYGGSTGLSWIDWILTDSVLTPPGFETHFSERVARLPGAFSAFRPRPDWPEGFPAPEGPPLFGCFSEPSRVDGAQVEWWARLLDRVPGSRILFKHGTYDHPALVEHWRGLFGALGGRADFEGIKGGWGAHMGVYGRVSVILDTWPVSGATSTLIPLWMGVPVVSVSGRRAGSRFGSAVLSAAGLGELVAADGAELVEIASALALDRDRLAGLRLGLRDRLRASPLLDGPANARAVEAAYRDMWRDACRRDQGGGT